MPTLTERVGIMKISALTVTEFVSLAEPLRESYYDGGYPTIGNAIDSIDDAIAETFDGAAYSGRKLYVTSITRLNQTEVNISVHVDVRDGYEVTHSYTVWYDSDTNTPDAFKYRLIQEGSTTTTVTQYTNFQTGEYRIYQS